ncbi:unnamed protein product [Boreogadus saida]
MCSENICLGAPALFHACALGICGICCPLLDGGGPVSWPTAHGAPPGPRGPLEAMDERARRETKGMLGTWGCLATEDFLELKGRRETLVFRVQTGSLAQRAPMERLGAPAWGALLVLSVEKEK